MVGRKGQQVTKTKPLFKVGGRDRPAPATTSPPSSTVPASGSSNPATSRSSVVLPQPDGPSTAVSDRAGTCRSTPVSTAVDPKALVTPESLSAVTVPPFSLRG